MKKRSFKFKLFGIVISLSLLSLAIFGTVVHVGFDAVRIAKNESVKSAAENVLDKIDRNLFERYGDVQAFALSEPARSGDPARLTAFMKDMMGAYAPIYSLMMVVNLKGHVVAANTVDKDGKAIDISSLFQKDYSEESWFKAAVADEIKPGTAKVEELHIDADVQQIYKNSGKVMNFTAAIRNEAGKVLGVWSNRMSWTDVVETIVSEQIAALKSERLPVILPYLLSSSGVYLVHPDGDQVLKTSHPDFASLKEKLRSGAFNGERHVETAQFNGDVLQGTALSKGYSLYPSLGWVATLEIPAADPMDKTIWQIAGVAMVLLLLGAYFSYLVVRGLSLNLDDVITHLTKESLTLKKSASHLKEQSTGLSQASMSQSASLQETASSVEEISAMVTKSSDSAERSLKFANTSQESATRGQQVVERMISSIEQINVSNTSVTNQFEQSNQELTNIIKVISEIGNKTKVINDIVFQTKLLSFNASVEAARAGEHGKGFAVVAEEVGNLAQMSGNAAKEISDMLNGSILTVEKIVQDTKSKVENLIGDSKHKIEEGISIARECGEVLNEIVKNENEINHIINEISIAGKEQATGVSEINKAIAQLDEVTHQNATRARETSEQANLISQNADEVEQEVKTLQILLRGSDEPQAAEPERKPVVLAFADELDSSPTPDVVEAAPAATAKVIPIHRSAPSNGLKTAVGSDVVLPSADDKRFEEI